VISQIYPHPQDSTKANLDRFSLPNNKTVTQLSFTTKRPDSFDCFIWLLASFEYLILNDKRVPLDKGRIAVDLKAGTIDLGIVKLSADQFRLVQASSGKN
jgi:hypothetical protein